MQQINVNIWNFADKYFALNLEYLSNSEEIHFKYRKHHTPQKNIYTDIL